MSMMTGSCENDETMKQIEIMDNGLTITIEGKSEDFWCQDLYIKAVTTLIENADIDGWVKHNEDWDALEKFYVSILNSMARTYLRACDFPLDEKGLSAHAVVSEFLKDFKNNSQLNKPILDSDLYEDEEE